MEYSNTDTTSDTKDSTYEPTLNSISKDNIPSFKKILVTHDGKDTSNNAINNAIAISNLSGAEIVLLRIVEDTDAIESTSVEVKNPSTSSNNNTTTSNIQGSTSQNRSEIGVQGPFIDKMEETIKKCRDAGCSNKITYQFRTGDKISEIIDEINTGSYDLIVLTSTHLDSWFKSLFSDTRKILSNIKIPVLISK